MTSYEQLPITFRKTFARYIKSFKFIGLDFFEDPKALFVNRCKFVTFVVLLLLFFTCQVLFFVKVDEMNAEFKDIANALPMMLLVVQNLFKLLIISKKDIIKHMILEIAELWPSSIENEEKETIRNEWMQRLAMLNSCIFNFTQCAIILYMWIPLFITLHGWNADDGTKYLYPFVFYLPFKIDSIWTYLLPYIYQAIFAQIIHTCLYQASDLLVSTLLADICILLRLLQYDLEHIRVVGKDKYGRYDSNETDKSYLAVKEIVRVHQKLIRLSENLNEFYGGVIFTVICFSSVILCFFGFNTIAFKNDNVQCLRSFVTVVQMLFIVFCITLPGQVLINTTFLSYCVPLFPNIPNFAHFQSCGVADAAYNSLWYESDLRFRKMIFIIIARSQKPCRLSALGYSDMNFNSFCKICSSAWSYLSLINQMYGEN